MKIRSSIQLERLLDKSLGWRKRELTSQKLAIDSAELGTAATLRRAGVVLLYAHWEGFIKYASKAYLSLFCSKPRKVSTLRPEFRAMALRSPLLRVGPSRSVLSHVKMLASIDQLSEPLAAPQRVSARGILTARSNVNAEVLREIVGTLGLDYSPFELKENQVIRRLVSLRHLIAHGEGNPIDAALFPVLHAGTITLLGEYRDQIVEAAAAASWEQLP